jgi:hypothetical protein
MLAIINRDTLQLEALVRAVPQQYSDDPFVAVPVEEYDPQAAFDKLHFTLLELQILYRNISGEHLRKISSFRGNVASAIQVTLRYGKPIASSTATLFETPPDPQQLPTPLPKHAHGVTTLPSKPKRPSVPRSSEPLETRNGVTRYRPGTGGGNTWDWLDAHPLTTGAELPSIAEHEGWALASLRIVFRNWKKFNGVSS